MTLKKTALIHVLLAMVALSPIWAAPLSTPIGHESADLWNHAWGAWWFAHSIGNLTIPWHTELLYGPDGGVLWYIDPIGATIGAPLTIILGVIGAWNATLLIYLSMVSYTASKLAEKLSRAGPHTFIASVAILFGPYLLSEVNNGISEAMNLAPAIFSLALVHTAINRGRRSDWVYLAISMFVTALGSLYYLLGTVIVVAIIGLHWLIFSRPTRRDLSYCLASVALSGAIIYPISVVMKASVYAEDALVLRASGMVEALKHHNAVDPRTYIAPFGFQSVDLAARGEAFLHSGYLGYLIIILAFYGAYKSRQIQWLVAAIISTVMGLGTRLFYNGQWVTTETGSTFSMPFIWIEALLPQQALTHSLRIAMPGIALFAGLAAVGLMYFFKSRRNNRYYFAACALVALEMITVGGSPWPVETAPPLDTEAAIYIRDSEHLGMVLDIPGNVGEGMDTSRYLTMQAYHGRSIPYRPDARAVTSSLLGARTFTVLIATSENRESHRAQLMSELERINDIKRNQLHKLGVSHVVVHRELERGEQGTAAAEEILIQLFGQPSIFGHHAVYEVVNSPGVIPYP
tara:strand:- start:39 stop:1760 length:1722 start_codon:yes stop_codon:yes gene_type:complete